MYVARHKCRIYCVITAVFFSSQDAKSQITSLENANGWFERRLAEADSQSEAAKSVTEEKLRSLKEEMEAKAKSDADGWETVRQPRGTKYMGTVEIHIFAIMDAKEPELVV